MLVNKMKKFSSKYKIATIKLKQVSLYIENISPIIKIKKTVTLLKGVENYDRKFEC
ncbi:MAG: hypothetical protein WCQ54_07175 [Clostridiaceae bacterium]